MTSVGLIGNPAAIALVWGEVSGKIVEALHHSWAELSLQDVYNRLQNGTMQLWGVQQNGGPEFVGVAVTEVVDYAQVARLRIVTLGGSHMAEWQEQLCRRLTDYAAYLNLQGLEAVGRPGLLKNLQVLGFQPAYVIYIKNTEAEPVRPSRTFSRLEELMNVQG